MAIWLDLIIYISAVRSFASRILFTRICLWYSEGITDFGELKRQRTKASADRVRLWKSIDKNVTQGRLSFRIWSFWNAGPWYGNSRKFLHELSPALFQCDFCLYLFLPRLRWSCLEHYTTTSKVASANTSVASVWRTARVRILLPHKRGRTQRSNNSHEVMTDMRWIQSPAEARSEFLWRILGYILSVFRPVFSSPQKRPPQFPPLLNENSLYEWVCLTFWEQETFVPVSFSLFWCSLPLRFCSAQQLFLVTLFLWGFCCSPLSSLCKLQLISDSDFF